MTEISTLAELVPRAAAESAPGTGVVGLDTTLMSWVSVERSTAQLAMGLVRGGVQPGDRVAILHPKSADSFLAVHAVLRCGAVVVPVDPFGAADAVDSILEQTEPAAIIGAGATLARLAAGWLGRNEVLVVATGPAEPLDACGVPADRIVSFADVASSSATIPLPPVDAEDPAYIIFTSGSTGVAKGIVHTHRSGLAYASEALHHHELDATSRLAGTTALHFDMSTLELYAIPLACATAVTISEAEQRFPATLSDRLTQARVTHLYAVPYLLRQLVDRGVLGTRDLSALRHVAYGGEPYAPQALAELLDALPNLRLLNVYGPAEVNAVTTHSFSDVSGVEGAIPIGEPWRGVELRIVDEQGQDVPDEQPGELLISAPTCMQGYWRKPELTASQFTMRLQGPPWYASGDLVVRGTDQSLIFVGRKDHQIKIRGVRIEPEAIEAVLSSEPSISHAVVGRVETEDGDGQLGAWLVMQPGAELDRRELRRWCRDRLPPVAIPSRVSVVREIPTTASGKIDRRALAETPFEPVSG